MFGSRLARSLILVLAAAPACAVTPTSGSGTDVDDVPVQPDSYIPVGGWVWPNGVVKYHLSTAFQGDSAAMTSFDETVREYESLTGLTFQAQTDLSQQTIWYELNNAKGCGGGATTAHTVANEPGPQIALCTRNTPTAVHETGHALGMAHEQKRPDAGQYLLCHPENIDTAVECCDAKGSNCNAQCEADPCNHGGDFSVDAGPQRALAPYDIHSTMQYYSTALSVSDTKATLTTKGGGTCDGESGGCIDFVYGLSIGDVNSLRQLYQLPLDGNQAGAEFGLELAAGDFDGDGFVDLAVGAPGNIQDGKQVGAVFVFKGTWGWHDVSANGPGLGFWGTTLVPWMKIEPSKVGITGQDGEKFGTALKAEDLDGDGIADLAIGAPGRNSGAGAVYVLYGHAYQQPGGGPLPSVLDDGLAATSPVSAGLPNYYTRSNVGGSVGAAGDQFGAALAWGKFDGGSVGALAVGEPGRGGGDVLLLQSGASGMTLLPARGADDEQQRRSLRRGDRGARLGRRRQERRRGRRAAGRRRRRGQGRRCFCRAAGSRQAQWWAGTSGAAGDDYGTALAFGDFRDTGRQALAVGAPGRGGPGRVQIMDVDSAGHFTFAQQIDESLAGDTGVTGDRFGAALRVAHFHGSAHADLLVGAPHKAIGSTSDAGVAYTFLAGSTGFTSGTIHHGSNVQAHGHFGIALSSGDFDGDGNTDAIFGASNVAGGTDGITAGIIMTEQGSSNGLTGTTWALWPAWEDVL